jgi:hypothetical protein
LVCYLIEFFLLQDVLFSVFWKVLKPPAGEGYFLISHSCLVFNEISLCYGELGYRIAALAY